MKAKSNILPTFIYCLCVSSFAVMMADSGYSIKTLEFWFGLLCIIVARECGEKIQKDRMKG